MKKITMILAIAVAFVSVAGVTTGGNAQATMLKSSFSANDKVKAPLISLWGPAVVVDSWGWQ
jgi:hypothetical protein